jgi:hypothetical protein
MKLMLILLPLLAATAYPKDSAATLPKPRIYIQPNQGGFESYVAGAIIKKNVPAILTQTEADSQYSLITVVTSLTESSASKVARCMFLYCIGINGSQVATVQLVRRDTNTVDWAYNVRKGGSHNFQSSAEAIAKHLKKFLEKKKL